MISIGFCSFAAFVFKCSPSPTHPNLPFPPSHADLVSVDVCLSCLVWANLLAKGGNNLSGLDIEMLKTLGYLMHPLLLIDWEGSYSEYTCRVLMPFVKQFLLTCGSL